MLRKIAETGNAEDSVYMNDKIYFVKIRSSHRRCSVKKVFLKVTQFSQEDNVRWRPDGLQPY